MTTFGYQDVGEAIAKYGTTEQAEELLPEYARGRKIGAMVMTEPGAGSDLQAIRLKAYQDEDGNWYLNGVKHFISNGNGDLLLVVARSEEGRRDMFGLSLFACNGGEKVRITAVEHKMGLHGSPTCELFFDDAPAQLIGQRKSGMFYVLNILNHARFSVAAQALGIAEGAYQEALAYAKERRQFGKVIYDMPPISNMLIEMRSTLDWMRSMVYAGARWLDLRNSLDERISELKREGEPFKDEKTRFDKATRILNLLSPMTKYVVTEAAVKICYDAQQLHGGLGYMREMAVERMARDVRITTIYEGASQVQIVSCSNSVKSDALKELLDEMASRTYGKELNPLKDKLEAIRGTFDHCRTIIRDSEDKLFQAAATKELVDMYSSIWIGYLLIGEATTKRKSLVARRYIKSATAQAEAARSVIEEGIYTDLEYRDLICD
jgi:alkylation response protein AidB-like acyl-CoA dehydrogenase